MVNFSKEKLKILFRVVVLEIDLYALYCNGIKDSLGTKIF
jgi:hypothetical protein